MFQSTPPREGELLPHSASGAAWVSRGSRTLYAQQEDHKPVRVRVFSKFEVAARGHRVICDQPFDSGGSDEGMSPPEFLLASLATCAAYFAAQYLKTRGLPAEDLGV